MQVHCDEDGQEMSRTNKYRNMLVSFLFNLSLNIYLNRPQARVLEIFNKTLFIGHPLTYSSFSVTCILRSSANCLTLTDLLIICKVRESISSRRLLLIYWRVYALLGWSDVDVPFETRPNIHEQVKQICKQSLNVLLGTVRLKSVRTFERKGNNASIKLIASPLV